MSGSLPRVLILAPTSKDAQATESILRSENIQPIICANIEQICAEFQIGAEAAILTEEAVLTDRGHLLQEMLKQQPSWSDFPLIVLRRAGQESDKINRALQSIGNMTLMNRPIHISTLLSHVRTALRDRQRQYTLRSQLQTLEQQTVAVAEANNYLELMLESSSDFAIMSLDPDGNVVRWTDGAKRIFGYGSAEVIGKPADIIFTPEDRAANVAESEMRKSREAGKASDERWHMRRNGDRFYASGTMAAMFDSAGKVRGFVKIARDMTEQKHAEEALISARNAAEAANIAKTDFLANMSHEIRTPMNAVIGLSTILGSTKPLSPKQRGYIGTLRTSADQLLALINDLLDIAKIEARSVDLEKIPFSFNRLLQEVIGMMSVRAREKGLSLKGSSRCPEDRMYIGDPTRVRQILLNLCSNAVKFTDEGSITIAIGSTPAAEPMSEQIIISVADTGIGIPPDKVANIFEKFTQADASINRRFGGTGLGLAITRTLTEVMGGTISLESSEGKGSTFKVVLTLKIADQKQVQDINESLQENFLETKLQARVLLVEDYPANILVASTYLESFGYGYDVAVNGIEAVEKAQSGDYSAALMDVQMPGMNGFEATLLIREFERNNMREPLPIIGMTAHALAGDQQRCIAAGMDNYISKPFNPAELELLLRKYTAKAA